MVRAKDERLGGTRCPGPKTNERGGKRRRDEKKAKKARKYSPFI